MNSVDCRIEADEADRRRHRCGRGNPRSAGGLGRKDCHRSWRSLCARRPGTARCAQGRRSRRLRDSAGAAEGGGLPGDGARRGHRRGERRHRRARPDAGRHPDRAWRRRLICSTRRTAPASPISRSTAIARPGRSAARGSGAGSLGSFFEATGGAPSSEALQSALNVIEAKAHFDAPERTVHIRVGGLDGRLYLDLGDESWRAVEIDATGWRVIDNPPVRFRRAAGMQPLPIPVSGGSVEMLRSFLNVQSDTDFVLVVAWALAVSAQSRSLSGARAVGRAGIGQVHLLGDPAGAARSEHRAVARLAARGSRPVHRRQQRPCARLRQRLGPAGVDFRHALPAWRPAAASPCVSSTPIRTRCCSTLLGR